MNKITLVALVTLSQLSAQNIKNETNQNMLCHTNDRAIYEQEIIHGIKQRVQVTKASVKTEVLKPGRSIKIKDNSTISCYNQLTKIDFYKGRKSTLHNRQIRSHVSNHERFDIASYANQDRSFVENSYGIARNCVPYKGGKSCEQNSGLTIIYNRESRVKTLIIKSSALKNGRLTFEPRSFNKISVNNQPLGLWISNKNKKLIKNRPSLISESVILWNKPTKYIKHIIMTSKNDGRRYYGGFNARNGEKKVQTEKLHAIEIGFILNDKAYNKRSKPKRW